MGNSHGVRREILPEEDGSFIICFLRAINVPKVDGCDADSYVRAYLIDDKKEVVLSNPVVTMCLINTSNPRWNCYRDLRVSPPIGTYLRCEIMNSNAKGTDAVLGHYDLPMNDFWDEEEHSFKCEIANDQVPDENFCIVIRRCYLNCKPPDRQVIFILRHGQSQWNKARSSGNLGALFLTDHGLTENGVSQATIVNKSWKDTKDNPDTNFVDSTSHPIIKPFSSQLLKQYYMQRFLDATHIYSSPLTRAIQTALVSFADHDGLKRNGLTLYSIIREKKGVTGMDTVGSVYGESIQVKVCEELEKLVGAERADTYAKAINIHVNDCNCQWWTSQLSYDSGRDVSERIDEFLKFARYHHSDPNRMSAIYVGHSVFFKTLCKLPVSESMQLHRPDLVEKMRKFKICNGGIMAITMKYTDADGSECQPFFEDAELLFNTTFEE